MTPKDVPPSALSALRSVAHPVRLRILSMLTAEAMSAAEVARALELTHANASYHLRVLVEAGELVLDSEVKVRGGVAKRYRYLVGGDPERLNEPESNEDMIAWQTATHVETVRRLTSRVAGPGIPATSSDIETWVTPEDWASAATAINEAMVLLHEQARAPRTAGTIHISASSQGFVMGDPQ